MGKRISLVFIVVMLTAIFSGCGKKSLTVYVVEDEALYMRAVQEYAEEHPDKKVKIESFASYSDMEARLSTELLSGKGPDVLLFDSRTGSADPYKMTVSSSVMPLDDMVAELSSEEYFTEILDAGYINGHQYYLPLSWNILQAYCTREEIKEKGYDDDLYTSIAAEFAALKEEEEYKASTAQFSGSGGRVNYLLEIAGQEVIDYETGELVIQEEEFRETADFLKLFYEVKEAYKAGNESHKNDFVWAEEHCTYFVEYFPFIMNMQYYQSVFPNMVDKEMYFAPFTRRGSEEITAQVMQYGAINANTKNKEDAWDLLRSILDAMPENLSVSKYMAEKIYYAPVNKGNYQASIDIVASSKGAAPPKGSSPLTEENAAILQQLPSRIGGSVIPNNALGALIQECMESYLRDEDGFDNCYEELIQRIELYLGE